MKKEDEIVFEKLKKEKIIDGIKDKSISIKYMKSYIWLFLILVIIGNLQAIMFFSTTGRTILPIFILIGLVILTIYSYLSQSYKLYFKSDYIILENKLKKKTIIDISKHPKIYIRFREGKSYNSEIGMTTYYNYFELYIEQRKEQIKIDLRHFDSKKLNLLINNLELDEKDNVSVETWQESMPEKEKNYENYIDFLNKQEKIIGVKDMTQNIKVANVSNIEPKKKFIVCIIVAIISCMLANMVRNDKTGDITNFLMTICAFALFFAFVFFINMVDNRQYYKKRDFRGVSYPYKGVIKVNDKFLNYEQEDIMIKIVCVSDTNNDEKYVYNIGFTGNETVVLNITDQKQFEKFIDNLIFKPKEENIQ